VAQFRLLAQHLYRGPEDIYEECQDSRRPELAANLEGPDLKSGALQFNPKCPTKRARNTEKAESKGGLKK
jgi:hypothetical protein